MGFYFFLQKELWRMLVFVILVIIIWVSFRLEVCFYALQKVLWRFCVLSCHIKPELCKRGMQNLKCQYS